MEKKGNVNHPAHYTQGDIECIDALAAATINLQGMEAVCTANAIKYLWRWKNKNGVEDLEKARWYIEKLISRLEGVKADFYLSKWHGGNEELPAYSFIIVRIKHLGELGDPVLCFAESNSHVVNTVNAEDVKRYEIECWCSIVF